MTLTQQHRSQLHDGLAPIVGADAIEALLSELPATDLDRPATEGFVRAEIATVRGEMQSEFATVRGEMQSEFAAVRGEMRTEFATVRGEMRTEFAAVRGEMHTGFAALRGEMSALRGEMRQDMAQLEARIADRFRSQTIWYTSTLTGGLALCTAIATAIARLVG